MPHLRAQARNDIRSCQKRTTMFHSDMPKLNSYKAPAMLSSPNLYTSGADQSFHIDRHRIKIATSASPGSADFFKGPRLGREKCDPRMLDHKFLKMHTSPSYAQRDDCAPYMHRKSVPAARTLSSISSSQSPSKTNIPVLDIKSVTALRPSTTRHSSQLAIQKKTSVAPLYVSKSGKADDNTLPPLLINSVHDKKDNKLPLYIIPNSDVSEYTTPRNLKELEAAMESPLSFAEAVDFEHIENFFLKDIETRIDPTGVASQTPPGNLPTLRNDDVRGEVVSNSSTTRLSIAENVDYKDSKRHITRGSLDTEMIKVAPAVTSVTNQRSSPRNSHATMTTLPPIRGSTSMKDGVPPDVVSSISSKYDPTQLHVPELSSRKDARHVKQNGVDSLQGTSTSIKNKEKEGCAHPKVLHPLQVFREFNIPKEMYDICFQPNTDKRYDRWKRTERNDKRRRTSMSSNHSFDEEDQESITAFHNLILCKQQKTVEDAVSRMRIFSNSGTDSCKSKPSTESPQTRHRKKVGSSSTASEVKPIRREVYEHPRVSLEDTGALCAKSNPYKDSTILPTLHKTRHKVTLDKHNTHVLPISPEKLDHNVITLEKRNILISPEKLKLYGSHPVPSNERPESLHNPHAIKSLPTISMARDTSVTMSWSTGDKSTPAMMGSDSKKGNFVSQHTRKTRENATLKSKPGRIMESGSYMDNYQASSPKSKAQASPAVGPLTPGMYNPGVTSAFTFSMFELPREHKDKNDTMKKKASVTKKTPKKSKY